MQRAYMHAYFYLSIAACNVFVSQYAAYYIVCGPLEAPEEGSFIISWGVCVQIVILSCRGKVSACRIGFMQPARRRSIDEFPTGRLISTIENVCSGCVRYLSPALLCGLEWLF